MQIIVLLVCVFFPRLLAAAPTIILNPAGDAKIAGRHILDSCERSYTLQIAHALKQRLHTVLPNATVLLTRIPGEIAEPLQYATFANRINADLYISIHCFEDTHVKPHAYVYQFSYGEPFVPHLNQYALYSYDQAHLLQKSRTTVYCTQWAQTLQKFNTIFELQGPFCLPFAPLIGVTCPAIGIELGLSDENSWKHYVTPLASALAQLFQDTYED